MYQNIPQERYLERDTSDSSTIHMEYVRYTRRAQEGETGLTSLPLLCDNGSTKGR
jgi:hypothetical protein